MAQSDGATLFDVALSQSDSDERVDVINPATGRRMFSIPAGCERDVERAVTASRGAFDDGRWSEAAPLVRKRVLHALADRVARDAALLDALDASEMGKPVSVRFCNAAAAAELTRFYAEAVDKINGDVYCSDRHTFAAQRRLPRGIVAGIVPWNFPTYCALLKIAPALAAGNCVLLKPSELSSRSAVHLGWLAAEAGLPPGVLQVIPGLGQTVGRALGLHKGVDMVSFTGSTEVGKLMLRYAAESNMKIVMAECGGKSPQIVFDDGVDLDAAAASIAQFMLTNQGQICSVGSRLLVQRSIEPVMVEKISAHMRQIVMGDPLDPRTTFGPLASVQQCSRVMQYIGEAPNDGALLVVGGSQVLQETGGYYVQPTLFRNVTAKARIAREEIFGPVLAVIPFEDEADAIRIANGTSYGLIAYVWTAGLSTAMRMARGIRSSVVVNAVAPTGDGAGHAASSEPIGQSGIGPEGGLAGMENYLRRQFVSFAHG